MKKTDIDTFFRAVAEKIDEPVKVYLTGGIASWLWGGVRPTQDIDFGVDPLSESIQKTLDTTSRTLKVPIQYASDLARWGMIDIPEMTRGTELYKRFGKLSVYLLAPEKWAIGKLTRYIESDESDLLTVFKKQKPSLQKCLRVWKQALKTSPASSEQFLFKKNVQHFLTKHGSKIWPDEEDQIKAKTLSFGDSTAPSF
jgi:hypothetical protein